MDFESLVGTTGIASSSDKLYVVDNKVIVILDSYGESEEVKHSFDWITGITLGELFLYGIYSKNDKYGLFSMDLMTHSFKIIEVNYTPVNLFYLNKQITVIGSEFKVYLYERNLVLREGSEPVLKVDKPVTFMTIGLTGGDKVYISKDRDVYDMESKKILTAEGTVLNLVYYQKYLFVIYAPAPLFNHYSVLQYDLEKKKNVKVVEGGHISGPPVYACIYENDLYISASTNNMIPLNMFDLDLKTTEVKSKRLIYSMFELNKVNQPFLTDKINIDTEKIKTLRDYGDIDTSPAQNSLIRYYVWIFIFIFILAVMLLAYFFKENSVFPVILLCILFIAISYVIKNRYFI